MPEENKFPICDRCKKSIETPAYVLIWPSIVLQPFFPQSPPLFSCIEHAENYSHSLKLHDDCWIDTLKDHGVQIHDMNEVKKKYAEEALKKLIESSSSSSSSSESRNE
jgi:hypothetical protein